MIIPGLCSVTFRKLAPEAIIELTAEAGLEAIEWGGDVHVPHGDMDTARRVRDLTLAAGLQVSSYGSYFRAAEKDVDFADALRTAVTLRTKTLRVWAGKKGTQESTPAYFDAVVADLKQCAAIAAEQEVFLALEFHDGTLTDSNEAAERLLEAVPGVSMIWQPKKQFDTDYRVEGLQKLLPRLSHLHVFNWDREGKRLPLADGAKEWAKYFKMVTKLPTDHFALLEFVADDARQPFLRDAATLKALLA